MTLISKKKSLLKGTLILILILFSVLCIYLLKNYRVQTPTQNHITMNNRRNTHKPPGKNQPSKANWNRNINNGMQINRGQRNTSNNKYSIFLTLYLIVFIGIFSMLLYSSKYRHIKIDKSNKKLMIFFIIFTGLLIRIAMSTVMEGYSGDINLFRNWASSAANNLHQFYTNTNSSDYPPLYIYVLYIIGKICSISSFTPYYTLMLKIPSILADVITSYLIYRISKKHFSFEMSMMLCLFYILNPAVFIDSALWGQVDSFFTLIIVLSIFMISRGNLILSSVLFTCSILMKPQGIIFLPVLFFELVRKKDIKIFIESILSATVTALIIVLPFSSGQKIMWILNLYSKTISEYPYASVNGFNFFNLLGGNYKQSSATFLIFSYQTWGMISIIAITLFAWFIYARGKNRYLAFPTALIQISGVFTFSTGMHERYLFPALVLSIISFIYLKDKKIFTLCIGYSITIYTNIYYILFSSNSKLLSDGISILNIILFIYSAKMLLKIAAKEPV